MCAIILEAVVGMWTIPASPVHMQTCPVLGDTLERMVESLDVHFLDGSPPTPNASHVNLQNHVGIDDRMAP
jgi:hypothetical protein